MVATQKDMTFSLPETASQHIYRRRLARAVGTNQSNKFARRDGEVQFFTAMMPPNRSLRSRASMSAVMAGSTGLSLDRTRTSAEIQERSPLPNHCARSAWSVAATHRTGRAAVVGNCAGFD